MTLSYSLPLGPAGATAVADEGPKPCRASLYALALAQTTPGLPDALFVRFWICRGYAAP